MKILRAMLITIDNIVTVLPVTKADVFISPVMFHAGDILGINQRCHAGIRLHVNGTEIRHGGFIQCTDKLSPFIINGNICGPRTERAFIFSKITKYLIINFCTYYGGTCRTGKQQWR